MILLVAVAAIGLVAARPAGATVINFEVFPLGGFSFGNEGGFSLLGSGSSVILPASITGSHSFGAGSAFQPVLLEILRPAPFTFDEFVIGRNPYSNVVGGTVTVRGYSFDSLLATDVFQTPLLGPALYVPTNLSGIAVNRLAVFFNSTSVLPAVDHIVLSNIVATPEPASAALLVAGVLGLIARRRL